MPKLPVPGAELNYEVTGQGPLLVVIPGAQGSLMVYRGLAERLKSRFMVLSYDRRGFSQSRLDGEQEYAHRLETDAADVAALIAHADQGPAIVFGSSSGAIVALTVLVRHLQAVRLLVAHEPPACRWLPDPEAAIAGNHAVYETWKAGGATAAMRDFAPRWLAASDREMLANAAQSPAAAQIQANMAYWFEHELRQYPATRFDMNALVAGADRLAFVVGEEMRGYPTFDITETLAAELNRPVTVLPGGHVGYATKPDAFAPAFAEMLAGAGAAPPV